MSKNSDNLFSLAAISDIHGNFLALNTVLDHMTAKYPILQLYCVGDIVGYGPQPSECIDKVLKVCKAMVKGNHDEAVGKEEIPKDFNLLAYNACEWHINHLSSEEKRLLYQLPTMISVEYQGKNITLVHGGPEYPLEQYIYPNQTNELIPFMELCSIDIFLMGHTHVPYVRKEILDNGRELLIINSGSVGQPRDNDPRASYAVIDVKNMEAKIERVPYNIKNVADSITEVGLPVEMGKRLYYGV